MQPADLFAIGGKADNMMRAQNIRHRACLLKPPGFDPAQDAIATQDEVRLLVFAQITYSPIQVIDDIVMGREGQDHAFVDGGKEHEVVVLFHLLNGAYVVRVAQPT